MLSLASAVAANDAGAVDEELSSALGEASRNAAAVAASQPAGEEPAVDETTEEEETEEEAEESGMAGLGALFG
jgi:large subunit ribosomal protein L10